MRRFLATSLIILALAVSAAGAAPAAHAIGASQVGDSCEPDTSDCAANLSCLIDANDKGYTCQDVGATNTGGEIAAKSPTEVDKAKEASWSFDWMMTKIMGLFAWLVGAAGVTLNYAMYYTVVGMGTYVKNLSAIGLVWTILRDIGNILLIFGFLAIGISIIIDSDWYGGGQKLLPKLLIVAVFTNFSLFAAEAVVDVGNLFATQIYKQINGGSMPEVSGGVVGAASDLANERISTAIMQKLDLTTIYGNAKDGKAFEQGAPWYMGFMSIILFIILAFVMFALALVLIARFVTLLLLIMVSPVGVAGLAVPGLQSWANKWWDTLFKQTITAPILLLLLYIALRVIVDPKFLGFNGDDAKGDWTGYSSANIPGFGSILLSYLVAMGLLLAVVYFAKSLSAVGAGWATKTAGKLSFGATALGLSAAFGGAALGARKGLQRYAPTNRAARVLSNHVLRPLENAKFDIRSAGLGKAMGAMGMTEASAPVGASAVSRVKQGVAYIQNTGQERDRVYDQETRIPRLRTAIARGDNATIRSLIANMSAKELESSAVQKLLRNSPVAVAALSQNRFDKLTESEALNDAQKDNLRNQRELGFVRQYTTRLSARPEDRPGTGPGAAEYRDSSNNPTPSITHPGRNMTRAEQAFRGLSADAVSQLPDAVLSQPEVYEILNPKQLNAIMRADKIKDATASTIGQYLRTDPACILYFRGRTPQQQQDLDTYWHTNLRSVTPAAAGGQPRGGNQQPPPPGYQQNPGGNIFIPS